MQGHSIIVESWDGSAAQATEPGRPGATAPARCSVLPRGRDPELRTASSEAHTHAIHPHDLLDARLEADSKDSNDPGSDPPNLTSNPFSARMVWPRR